MKVLSLFDGMSCGRIALERAGIEVDLYLASEVDKYAIQISDKNYPDIIQIGDVTRVNKHNQHKLPEIDLLIGGSPCQGFSFAGKGLNFDDPRSKLFFEYVRLLKECEPKYFLLENVRMKQEFQDVISDHLGVQPININSSLVSAQNRNRFYWTNIPVSQPEDKGIILSDILEDSATNVGRVVGRKLNPETGKRDDYNPDLKAVQRLEPRLDAKSGCLTTVQKDNVVITNFDHVKVSKRGRYKKFQDKASCLTGGGNSGGNHSDMDLLGLAKNRCFQIGEAIGINGHDLLKRVYADYGKAPTVTTITGGNQYSKIAVDDYVWRRLTPIECERLQTVPDNYTEGVSNTQRYKMLGNGWTVDVIAHILKGLK